MTDNRTISISVMVCLTCFIALDLAFAWPAEDKIVVKTENGIPVVYNPKNPAPPVGSPCSLTLQHELTIGEDDTDPNSMFSQLRSIQVDDQENIYALDMKETKIKVYDKNGKFLRSFGKKGKGPGEIDLPIRMEMNREGNIVIADMGNNKLIYFAPDGKCIKELPTGKYWALIRFKFDAKGNIYADTRAYEETRMTSELKKFTPDFKPLATFASLEEKRTDPAPYAQAFSAHLFLQMKAMTASSGQPAKSKSTNSPLADGGGSLSKRSSEPSPVKITGVMKDRLSGSWGEKVPAEFKFEIPVSSLSLFHHRRRGLALCLHLCL
jgi:hypothetical protein